MDVWAVPVSTARTLTRSITPADVDALVELSSDEHVRAYLGGARPAALAREKAAGRIAVARPGDLIVVERTADAVIGHLDLQQGLKRWELSYEFLPAVWGRGLAHEAIGAVLQRLSESMVDLVVVAETHRRTTVPGGCCADSDLPKLIGINARKADQVLYAYRASSARNLSDSD